MNIFKNISQIFKEYASELNNTVLFKNYKYSDEIRYFFYKNPLFNKIIFLI